LLQLGLWGLADLLYEGVRGLVVRHSDIASANAHSLVSLEKSLGIFWEPHLQSLILGHDSMTEVSDWLYLNIQFTVNAVFLALLYTYRNDIFYFVRNMFFVAMGIALVVHLAVPVAPPRLLPGLGFVDTIHQVAHINQDSGAISLFVNPYAAVPSMHMCFALLVGVTIVRLVSRWWLRALALAYPLLVLVVIVVTANHFLLDAVAGALTALLAGIIATQVMARARPAAWSWAQVVVPAPSSAQTAAVAVASNAGASRSP
jgi:membrane-associated phospholipid phosphatase